MTGLAYNLLLILASPVLFLLYLRRIFITRKSSESWRANLGALPRLTDREPGRKLIWIHAASVGEVIASQPVRDALCILIPDALILLTTITQTGNEVARKSARDTDAVSFFPLDFPLFVRRALNRVRPDIFVMVETEIWPNFLSAVKRMGVPSMLINGRISDRSVRRGRRWRWLLRWAVRNIDQCCMQSQVDADRILAFGARPETVKVFGNTKFDQDEVHLPEDAVHELRADLGLPEGVPVFVAGSTNPGEDEPVLEAFRLLREDSPNLRLIIAPRQIDRAGEIESLVKSMGFSCARRSSGNSRQADDVLILDTFGELAAVYSVAGITFVGGSLIPKGGHSIFQPIMQGKPVMFGPHMHNFRDISHLAIAAGVGFEVHGSEEIASVGGSLLADRDRLPEIDAACRKLIAENRGASGRCAELIAGLVQEGTGAS